MFSVKHYPTKIGTKNNYLLWLKQKKNGEKLLLQFMKFMSHLKAAGDMLINMQPSEKCRARTYLHYARLFTVLFKFINLSLACHHHAHN